MNKKTFSRYFGIFKGIKLPWLLIIGCFAFSALTMKAELQSATLTADIVDVGKSSIDGKVLANYILVVALAAVCNIFGNYFTYKMEETINMRVRVSLWTKIMHLPAKYYDEDNGDGLVSRVTSDAEAPSSLFSMAVSFVVCVITTVQAFIQLFSYHKTLAMIALLIIPVTLIFCIFYGKIMFRIGVYGTVTTAGSMAYLAERVRNFRLMKSALAEKSEAEKGDKTFKEMYKADFLSWLMVAGYQLMSGLFSIAFIVITFVVGGQFVKSGAVTVGDLTGFYLISGIVTLQLMQFFMNVGSVTGTFGTMQKISNIMSADSESDDGEDVPDVQADIIFDNVSFGYDSDRPVLSGLNLRIPAGKVTAVIGENGAGKSTLFKLISRLYEPTSGKIYMDGKDIGGFRLSDWRDRFSYVFQNMPLIGGTVRENITYGLGREVGDEELISVAKDANCYDCIAAKPKGFDEDVGLNGSNFSGGQGQCISVARAMLRKSDYLLLDEATSNLDMISEAHLTEALERLMKGKTTVMIAHNYAATRGADYIIVMKDGSVQAEGTPEELLRTNEYYRMFCKTL
jgi:ATP-binding cassette, subfamily B, bacterial AbcA/BmrA